ncbi:hypothetical protein THAOC_35239, partial [Thalassiosira oceanica]
QISPSISGTHVGSRAFPSRGHDAEEAGELSELFGPLMLLVLALPPPPRPRWPRRRSIARRTQARPGRSDVVAFRREAGSCGDGVGEPRYWWVVAAGPAPWAAAPAAALACVAFFAAFAARRGCPYRQAGSAVPRGEKGARSSRKGIGRAAAVGTVDRVDTGRYAFVGHTSGISGPAGCVLGAVSGGAGTDGAERLRDDRIGVTADHTVKEYSMAEQLDSAAADTAVVNGDKTCGICLEDSKNPLELPCGHSFCDGCLNRWRSRYGVEEEMRRRCPICRAMIPPSKEMVAHLLALQEGKLKLENMNDTSSENYHRVCNLLKEAEERVGADWDGVTILEDNNDKPPVVMPDYIVMAIRGGDVKSILKWITANRAEDRANATSSVDTASMPVLCIAAACDQPVLMAHLLQFGANVDGRANFGGTAMFVMGRYPRRNTSEILRLLLSWGASFFPEEGRSREDVVSSARKYGQRVLADLLESELGGRRCEITNLSALPELNGKTCVADEYLPASNQYKVTLENKTKEVLVLGPGNLTRRDRTPQDCGYYIEFRNGRTIRHDFDSSEDCKAFVAALNRDDAQPVVTVESEAAAEQAAAELLAELGLDDSSVNVVTSGDKAKKSKKKKGGKRKKKK